MPSPSCSGRAFFRSIGLCFLAAGMVLSYPAWILLDRRSASPQRRTRWFQFWGRLVARWIGLDLRVEGSPPPGGLLISNHQSYLDIVVLSQAVPCVFVSKSEVRSWFFFGRVATLLGTVFVDRSRAASLPDVVAQMQERLQQGLAVVLFPEGTTGNGSGLLPFRSSTLAAAQSFAGPVTPAALVYQIAVGSVADWVCYWGDHHFISHLWKLLGLPGVRATVRFGSAVPPQPDRKKLSQLLEQEVRTLFLGLIDKDPEPAKIAL
jgi:lyso-ornithine lipid O-acyltransferase